jgi:hypothetical protein
VQYETVMSNDSPGETDAVFTYDISAAESASEAVVAAVATVSDVEPASESDRSRETIAELALDPLYSVVDPDALDAMFRPGRTDGSGAVSRVSFPYHGHDVTVHGEGRVDVRSSASSTAD